MIRCICSLTALAALLTLAAPHRVLADPPPNPVGTFATAKKKALHEVYFDRLETFYCRCSFAPAASGSSGRIDHLSCGYEVRKNLKRAARLEWEHVMPAHRFGGTRECWKQGHDLCVNSHGRPFMGRSCCAKSGVDDDFRLMEADLHNLVPSVGEVNGDRSNHPYGLVSGELREYGACDFELGGSSKHAEASEDRRGDVARIYLYMSQTYNIELTDEERALIQEWLTIDPVDDWERTRNGRINDLQGNLNPLVN